MSLYFLFVYMYFTILATEIFVGGVYSDQMLDYKIIPPNPPNPPPPPHPTPKDGQGQTIGVIITYVVLILFYLCIFTLI